MTGWIGLYKSLNAMRELVMAGDAAESEMLGEAEPRTRPSRHIAQ